MRSRVASLASREATLDPLLARADRVRYLDLPPRSCLTVDGAGAPGPETLQPRMALLYPIAYGVHFALKKREVSARVGPLEGLWWNAGKGPFDPNAGEGWQASWTLLIGLPDEASDADLAVALADARRKYPDRPWDELRVETFAEGLSAQILHLGPYDREGPTIERLHTAIVADGFRPRGRHHEIYLGDPRRAAPDRLRTILRQPVEADDPSGRPRPGG